MKKEIPMPVLVGVIVLAVLILGAVLAANFGPGPDPTKVQPDDYKYEPGEIREKLQKEAETK